MSVEFAVSFVRRLFSALCHALPPGFLHLFYLRLLAPLLHWGVGWAAALPLRSQCFSCAGWLADDRWFRHPVTGFSH